MTVDRPFAFLALLCCVSMGCERADADRDSAATPTADLSSSTPPIVRVTARDFAFDVADTLPAGWTTLDFENAGQEEHFAYLYRLPEDKTFEDLRTEALAPFGAAWYGYVTGEISREEAEDRFRTEIPAWFYDEIISVGGAALTEPGERARVTIDLEPGTYVLECYVKRPDGTWHTELGMQRTVVVATDEDHIDAAPPEVDATMTLSNYEIEMAGQVTAGPSVIEVRAENRPEGLLPHDINLFRLEEGVDLPEIVEWMDWMEPEGFRAPAPGRSLGGMEHLSPDRAGYVHLDLEPGSYAWVSEGYGDRGMVREFTIP
jgi:hypothetical protein